MAFRRDRTAAGLAGRFLRLPGDWEDEDGGPSRAGWTVSAVGHVGLLLFLLFGGIFDGAPLPPLEVAEVTVISEEEFALLTRPQEAAEAGEGVTAPEPPRAPTEAPTPPPARPEIAEAPAEPEPAPTGPPELTAPPPVEATPDPPAPEAAPRVAPEAAPEPPVEAEQAPVVVEETAPAPEPEPETVAEEQQPAAPPEAAPEIVTEAERPSGTPDATPRPRARPDRVVQTDPGRSFEATSEPEPAPQPDPTPPAETPPAVAQPVEPPAAPPPDDALAAAIAGAVADAISNVPAGAPETGAPAGPPLSQGEMDAFRVSVQRCWIVDPGSPAASVTVVVGMRLTRDAKPDTASIRQLGSRGGDDSATRAAFEAARRAILRCGAEGFPLPPEKYERWAEVEMTFNPEEMRIR